MTYKLFSTHPILPNTADMRPSVSSFKQVNAKEHKQILYLCLNIFLPFQSYFNTNWYKSNIV